MRLVLFVALAFLPASVFCESRFEWKTIERDGREVDLVLVHHADGSATPTASFAALAVRSTPARAALRRVQEPGASGVRVLASPVSRPTERGDSQVLPLLVWMPRTAPDATLPHGAELLRLRVVLPPEGAVVVELLADLRRGGLRSWSGGEVSAGPALLARVDLGEPVRQLPP